MNPSRTSQSTPGKEGTPSDLTQGPGIPAPDAKKVFYLRYTAELPIKAIAARINRSEGTVKTHLHKAHHQLRDLLRPYLQNEDIEWLV